MSYKITSCKYIGPGLLTIEEIELARAMIELRGKTPEGSFIDDTMKLRPLTPGLFEITHIDWQGENATDIDHLVDALSHTQGMADVVLIWEGGDSITGLRVNDGEVTAHDVVVQLGKAAE